MDKGNQPLLLWHKDDPHSGLEIRKRRIFKKNIWLFATKGKEKELPKEKNGEKGEISLTC